MKPKSPVQLNLEEPTEALGQIQGFVSAQEQVNADLSKGIADIQAALKDLKPQAAEKPEAGSTEGTEASSTPQPVNVSVTVSDDVIREAVTAAVAAQLPSTSAPVSSTDSDAGGHESGDVGGAQGNAGSQDTPKNIKTMTHDEFVEARRALADPDVRALETQKASAEWKEAHGQCA